MHGDLNCLFSAPDIRSGMGWAHQTSCRSAAVSFSVQQATCRHCDSYICAPALGKALHLGGGRSSLHSANISLPAEAIRSQ